MQTEVQVQWEITFAYYFLFIYSFGFVNKDIRSILLSPLSVGDDVCNYLQDCYNFLLPKLNCVVKGCRKEEGKILFSLTAENTVES